MLHQNRYFFPFYYKDVYVFYGQALKDVILVFNTYKQLSKSEIKMLPWLRPWPANLRVQLSGHHGAGLAMELFPSSPQSEKSGPVW